MTESDNRYIAVIGDAIGSRELAAADRTDLQERIRATLATVNTRWADTVAANFAIALGDQFEGLLRAGAPLWEIIHVLRAELRGVDWVIACARGAISTPLAATAPEVDGPCFHLARDALARAKADELVLTVAGYDEDITALAAYYSALYWSWTARQREVAALLRVMEPAAVAQRLGVDRSAISHLTSRMRWSLVVAADTAFRAHLEAS